MVARTRKSKTKAKAAAVDELDFVVNKVPVNTDVSDEKEEIPLVQSTADEATPLLPDVLNQEEELPALEPVAVEEKENIRPVQPVIDDQVQAMMLSMQNTITAQAALLTKMTEKLESLESAPSVPVSSVIEPIYLEADILVDDYLNMNWDVMPSEDPPAVVAEAPSLPSGISRREKSSRPYEEMYATEQDILSDNITLLDASSSMWGAIPQTNTHVGMRSRSLLLNPTLQQASIGGLL